MAKSMTQIGIDRFLDLNRQGFMKPPKAKKPTAAQKKDKAERDAACAASWAKFREEETARFAAYFAEDEANAN